MGLSALVAVAPLAAAAEFFNPPYKFVPVRMKIDGASSLAKGSALFFSWPTDIRPFDTNIIIREDDGGYYAYNRVCTHLQCVVNYDSNSDRIVCPCHGSIYDARTGAVTGGPAPKALPKIILEVDDNGDVFAVNADGVFGYGRSD